MSDKCENDAGERKAVYYDGSCPMCTAIINKIDDSSKGGQFSLRNIKTEALPQDFTKQDVEREMHVVDANGKVYRNAEAILKILEEFPAWKVFGAIGRLPLIKQILPIGYNFVARNRHFLFGPASRIYWLKVFISFGFILGLLLSSKLWISSRFYPLTPMLNVFPPIPHPLDWVFPLSLIGFLAAAIIVAKPKPFIWLAVVLACLLVFLDQQRLQPWVYQYTFMLASLGLFSWKFDDIDGKNATLNICRFIVASIYFWSGLQKLNVGFVHRDFPWMIAPIEHLFPASEKILFYVFGMSVPIIEMGIGIGLLIAKFRNIAIGLAMAMCIFVLWADGPFGYAWNSVVWPWNVTMVLLVFILFAKTDVISIQDIFPIRSHVFQKIVWVVFGFLPLLYFFNVWDSYLSWSLYSGTTNQAAIYMSDRVKEQLPSYLQKFEQIDSHGRNILSISNWAFGELNVPPYPETRIFKSIARSICKEGGDPRGVILAIRGRRSWFFRDAPQALNCAQLDGASPASPP